jgi:hypothetical protein
VFHSTDGRVRGCVSVRIYTRRETQMWSKNIHGLSMNTHVLDDDDRDAIGENIVESRPVRIINVYCAAMISVRNVCSFDVRRWT